MFDVFHFEQARIAASLTSNFRRFSWLCKKVLAFALALLHAAAALRNSRRDEAACS